MEQVRTNGEQKELRDEIVDLGTRYGIVTPYTSYLALEGREVSQGLNVLAPSVAGSRGRASGGFSNMPAPKAKGAADSRDNAISVTGQGAVQESVRVRAQQDEIKIETDTPMSPVRRVAGKTFYLVNGVWTDSEFKADSKLPETVLVFGNDEYFALLKQKPKLAEYFSLGERVVVVLEGRVYRVNAAP